MVPAVTTALSAFLLFLIQPVVARSILPWFGGTAAVWTTALVFFQVMLVAGYAYADLLTRKLAPKSQWLVHGALLLTSLALLPVGIDAAWKPADADNPIGRILLLLSATIGLPYLMLATTGPLLQSWAGRRRDAARTYQLYALSNAGSLLALLAYPTLVEPRSTNPQQMLGWSAGYAAFVALGLIAAWHAGRDPAPAGEAAKAGTAAAAPGAGTQALWALLPLLSSALLLAVTNHITRDIATIPFLWILPLTLYLISFILCFQGRHWYWRKTWTAAGCLLAMTMLGGLGWRVDWTDLRLVPGLMPITDAVVLYLAGLFALCMFCHGELARRAPATAHLTRFYLMVAVGGAVGGALVGILAPLALRWHWELPIALLGFVLVATALAPGWIKPLGGLAVVVCGWWTFAYVDSIRANSIELTRNFYGALRVKAEPLEANPDGLWTLMHGSISHGAQLRQPGGSRQPTTYYGEGSGVGRALLALNADASRGSLRVGLIGMGVGTLATYGRDGDVYRFYEVNPAVVALARKRFTFLRESPASIEVALGDARLSLERETPQRFDLLVIDAFSGDAIPVHLLTREAAQVYRRHLAQDGVIALHVSNRYLDLTGICQQLAEALDWQAWQIVDQPRRVGQDGSEWVLVTGNRAVLERLQADGAGRPVTAVPGLRPWTDESNSLFQILR